MAHKLTGTVAQEILRLYNDKTDIAEIALLLNLKKMQVSAVVAHSFLSTGPPRSEATDEIHPEASEIDAETAAELSRSAIVEEYSAPGNLLLLTQGSPTGRPRHF